MSSLTPSSQAASLTAIVPPANCFTVMIVDDLPANRVLLNKVLRGAGYAVIEAKSGLEAIELLRGGAVPDLIVTDIEMPELDGISFVREIRRLEGPLANVPVISASGNADDSMRREAIAGGCDVFMTKPFDLARLRREIGDLIRGSRRTAGIRQNAPRLAAGAKRSHQPVREAS